MLFGTSEKLSRLHQEIHLLRQDHENKDRHLDEIRIRAETHAAEKADIERELKRLRGTHQQLLSYSETLQESQDSLAARMEQSLEALARMETASVLVLRNLETMATTGENTPSALCVGQFRVQTGFQPYRRSEPRLAI
jgi:chromosome segregation ATPase